jgi:O-antigen ligase
MSAAVQIGAVVASGSRAGTVLVILELLALIALAYGKNRNKNLLLGAALAIALSLVFIYAAGFETLITKLQQNDLLAVRRNIDRSSLAMIHDHPFAGWGLDTYVPVYRMFARYDDGTFVNRAHNDWLEWTSDGGIFFSGTMLLVLLWSMRPAIRSGWGIGLIAFCIHALVDYPFARLGVCGWYFCFLGMLSVVRVRQRRAEQSFDRRSAAQALGLRPTSRLT